MDARAIIKKLRDKQGLSQDEISWFAQGLANGKVTDSQAGAFAMAAVLNGMSDNERVSLTLAMRDSGDVMAWDLPGPVIDKHSTGGIGDCLSLLLAPALAALGTYVPMVSGRGLGHTGGTLDKLEAIPGLKTEVSNDRFVQIVESTGAAIVSATGTIAPADKRLYAIRDVTATVESIDLITASILSKKLAAGLEALVLDVKVGSGAFMKNIEDATALAQSLVSTSNGAGCKTSALVTDMNQPLVPSVGNALEVMAVMDVACGNVKDSDLLELTAALGGELLVSAGAASNVATGALQIEECIADGSAAERFGRMIADLGGPTDFVEHWADRLPSAPVVIDVIANTTGYLDTIDGEAMGLAVVALGGGRMRQGDAINPAVGLSDVARLGRKVEAGDVIARVHASDVEKAEQAVQATQSAMFISDKRPATLPLIHKRV